jgi:hypothetical protein
MLHTAPGSGHGDVAACAAVALAPNPMTISKARRDACRMIIAQHSWRRGSPLLQLPLKTNLIQFTFMVQYFLQG